MRYLSLFSGIEAASCAWQPLGWELAGVCEIEKFPCNVLAHHYPDVPNLGDITQITKDRLQSLGHIDLIVGGSPCQGFSVAGKQEGLKDVRSKLAIDYLRVINTVKPQWIVWENVPGVFSTGGGLDFKLFTAALTRIGYGICWRVLDSQWFGVAQRRRRVFLVGYFGDWRPSCKVLFESQSLPGYFETLQRKKERLTSCAKGSIGKAGKDRIDTTVACMGYGRYETTAKAETLRASGGDLSVGSENLCYDMNHPCDVIRTYTDGKTPTLEARMGTGGNNIPLINEDKTVFLERQFFSTHVGKTSTLTATIRKDPPVILDDQGGSVMNISDDGKVGTLRAETHNHQPIVTESYRIGSYHSNAMKSDNPHSGIYQTETANTLNASDPTPACRQGGIAVCVQGSVVGRKTENGPQGSGVNIEKSFTLNTTDRHAVAVHSRVRKLTPTECLRLQGFPDDWFKDVAGYSDTAAYKAIGNSMAVPCMRWIGEQIQRVAQEKLYER